MPQKPSFYYIYIFVIVIQKEDWQVGAHQSFFWYDTGNRFVIWSLHKFYYLVSVIPKEGLGGPAGQSFFWYDNDKELKRFLLVAHASLVNSHIFRPVAWVPSINFPYDYNHPYIPDIYRRQESRLYQEPLCYLMVFLVISYHRQFSIHVYSIHQIRYMANQSRNKCSRALIKIWVKMVIGNHRNHQI